MRTFPTRAKTEAEIAALIAIIKDINPDVLGVCEMGTPDRFEDFKKRLAAAGLGYTDSNTWRRRIRIVISRCSAVFPSSSRQSATDVSFELNGRPEKVRRGFLDVTIQVNPDYQLRMVGAHLKSKLPIPEGEALIRRYEAVKLRAHLDAIMTRIPKVNLVCYGDFNDTKNEPMFSRDRSA